MAVRVMLEVEAPPEAVSLDPALLVRPFEPLGFSLDQGAEPVPMGRKAGSKSDRPATFILSGALASADQMAALRRAPGVVQVWADTEIAPMKDNPSSST